MLFIVHRVHLLCPLAKVSKSYKSEPHTGSIMAKEPNQSKRRIISSPPPPLPRDMVGLSQHGLLHKASKASISLWVAAL